MRVSRGAGRCRGSGDHRPDPEERGEDLIAGPGRSGDVLEPGDEIALVFEDVDAACGQCGGDPRVAGAAVRGDLPGPGHRIGARLGGDAGQHPGRVAGADDQGPAAVAQLGVERVQAGPQECAPGRCPMVPPSEQYRIGDPHADHGPAVGGTGECRVVVDAQVATEPDDGGGSGHRLPVCRAGAPKATPSGGVAAGAGSSAHRGDLRASPACDARRSTSPRGRSAS